MELKEFIANSLIEISDGVFDAQKAVSSTGTQINPHLRNVFAGSQSGGANLALGYSTTKSIVVMVEFDVAVTVSEGKETKGGIGVVGGIVGIGAQGKSDQAETAVSRIKFSIPMALRESD